MKPLHMILTLSLSVISITTLYSQDTQLFKYAELQTLSLTERQLELKKSVDSREYSKGIHLVLINNVQELKNRSFLSLNLPNEETIKVQQTELRMRNEQQFSWRGATSPSKTVQLIVTEKGVTGWVHTSDYYYMIEPLGDNLHLLIEVEPDKFPQESQPLESEEIESNKNRTTARG